MEEEEEEEVKGGVRVKRQGGDKGLGECACRRDTLEGRPSEPCLMTPLGERPRENYLVDTCISKAWSGTSYPTLAYMGETPPRQPGYPSQWSNEAWENVSFGGEVRPYWWSESLDSKQLAL